MFSVEDTAVAWLKLQYNSVNDYFGKSPNLFLMVNIHF